MNRYSEIHVALDFAVKYEASSVTIDTDRGTYEMTPREAEELFADLNPGEAFVLLAIEFNN